MLGSMDGCVKRTSPRPPAGAGANKRPSPSPPKRKEPIFRKKAAQQKKFFRGLASPHTIFAGAVVTIQGLPQETDFAARQPTRRIQIMQTSTPPATASRPGAPAGGETPRNGWELTAERGPDWLFVRVEEGRHSAGPTTGLTQSLWNLISEHHASRVVLELQGVERMDDSLFDAIAEIGARMRDGGGLVRVCGLSQASLSSQPRSPAAGGVPCFRSRTEAVGTRPCLEGRCE
jgi:hypothetical protein